MSDCEAMCPLEVQQQDERSPGVIGDDELICRAAYDPIAFRKNKVTAAIVRGGDLLAGTLSVWRCSELAGTTVSSITEICRDNAPAQASLAQILAVKASAIRNARSSEIKGRLFCVVDETETDDEGGSHQGHAHIKICMRLREQVKETDDLKFKVIKETLVFLFRQDEAKLHPA